MKTEVTAVVGACGPERHRYARWLARYWDAELIAARHPDQDCSALERAVRVSHGHAARRAVVLEYPVQVPALEIIGEIVDGGAPVELTDLICVVDAPHLIADLTSTERLDTAGPGGQGDPAARLCRGELVVTQIEYASAVVLVNAEHLGSQELNLLLSLISHLAPKAQLDVATSSAGPPARRWLGGFRKEQTQAGWLSLLNDDFHPRFEDPDVVSFRYEQLRPMHPGRFSDVISRFTASCDDGMLLRSAGFVHLATRPHVTAHWDQVGAHLSLAPACLDHELSADDEPLALGQDLVLMGLGVDADRLAEELDGAALTDRELTAGPMEWATYPDPFPGWSTADQ
ncbi:GTP-binding protein [Kocuria coralli]|nr:GTP-binding protein [Kocuria coralli]